MNRHSHGEELRKSFLHEMTWQEIKVVANEKTVAIIPTGSIEQHGPHLPIGTDSYIVYELTDRLAEKLKGKIPFIIAPPVVYGASSHHLEFPGTLSLTINSYIGVMVDICESLIHYGFKRILLLNSHGGNRSPLDIVIRNIRDRYSILIGAVTYWTVADRQIDRIRESEIGGIGHAGELETSCMLVIGPQLVHKDLIEKNVPRWKTEYIRLDFQNEGRINLAQHMVDFTSTGVNGDPTLANETKGERFLIEISDELSKLITEFSTWEIGKMANGNG